MFPRSAVIAFSLLAPSLFADALTCGTGAIAVRREARLERAHELRPRGNVAANALPNVEARNGVVLVDATDANALFRQPFDLIGRSLRFVPAGGDAFSVTNVPAVAPESRGTEISLTGSPAHARYTLANFSFPFGGRALGEVVIGSDFAIRTEPPATPFNLLLQYDALEAATYRGPLIAPLLNPKFPGRVNVFVRDTPEAVTFTWTDSGSYDVRATLHRSGAITFSYLAGTDRENAPTLFGVPAVVTGSVYDRTDLTALGSGVDAVGEPDPAMRATTRPAVDFKGATLHRLGDTDLLRLDIDLAGPLPSGTTSIGSSVMYSISVDGARRAWIHILDHGYAALGTELRPVGHELKGSNALRIAGPRMTVWLTEELLGLTGAEAVVKLDVVVFDGRKWDADEMTFRVAATPAEERVERDFSAAATFTRRSPLVEGFTLPSLVPRKVWEDVKSALRWSDGEWDGVMIFQNFDTDLGLEGLTSYSTYGFSADDGINMGYDDRPTLMHVGRVRRTLPPFHVVQNAALLHEFAHRWLFAFDIAPGARGWDMLSPDGWHPAQWVDTRAAFPVHHTDSCSALGGAFWQETAAGRYKAGTRQSYGYSWLDLYGMGLAAASEVPPSFYFDGTTPELGDRYLAPAGIEISGTRKPITIQEVIARQGPRNPAWPNTRRRFRVAFVLVREPERAVTPAELAAVRWERDTFVREFSLQTGGRGSIDAPAAPSKRRAARH